jgi:hypothetical protein
MEPTASMVCRIACGVVRVRHPLGGRSLEVPGFPRRRGVLHLLLVLPDGSRSLIPAAWTDLEPADAAVQENRSTQAGAQTAPLIEREAPPGPRTRPTDNIR